VLDLVLRRSPNKVEGPYNKRGLNGSFGFQTSSISVENVGNQRILQRMCLIIMEKLRIQWSFDKDA
jgi:hypothetical protein